MLLRTLVACLLLLQSALAYREKLDLRPLPRNSLLASFSFSLASESAPTPDDISHYGLFPRSVGQIIRSSHATEIHLRFSQGWWDASEWGSLPEQGAYAGGTGVEVWAWVDGADLAEAEKRWYELVNALSGLFCASLNFVDSTKTILRSTAPSLDSNKYLFHGSLPSESVCTENLTPFMKLLPCKGHAGISSLLDGHKIFDSKWQSMALDFTADCDDDSCKLVMSQRIDVVLDVLRSLERQKHSPVPIPRRVEDLMCDETKPYHSSEKCFPLPTAPTVKWLISEIFGKPIVSKCALETVGESEASELGENAGYNICTHITDAWSLSRHGGNVLSSFASKACFSLNENEEFNLAFDCSNTSSVSPITSAPVHIQRSMTGRGQQHGGIQAIIRNPSPTDPITVTYFETLPWFMKPYLSSMTTHLSGPDTLDLSSIDPIKNITYKPFMERVRSTHLELTLEIPAASTLTLSYDFDKTLIYLAEYPPDANRGFDVSPGILRVVSQNDEITYSMRTSSLLLSLPTPDFSMPYNVIILTSTVMALLFGTVFNILVRRFVYEEDIEADKKEKGGLKQRLLKRFRKDKTEKKSSVKSAG
ncbi:GPI transamidase component PIG-T [Myxozyma melibiosi]|uniref:GPI transamidase component PIG-T n=1 Tax=Myxozyma melibiosi TaxID=54550 RepID=A0ABR1F9H4_9ASCO